MSAETGKELAPAPNGGRGLQVANPMPTPDMAPRPSYIEGFDGMATQPFPEEVRKVLAEPVNPEDVEIKPDGIVYLPGVFYRDRLFRAFGPGGWALAPRGPIRTRPSGGAETVIYHGALFCLGRFVGEAVGKCDYWLNNAGMTYADAAEGAKTDCITKCCKDLAIARELWDPGWREQWQAKYARLGPERNKKGDLIWKRKPRGQKLASAAANATPPEGAPANASVPNTGAAGAAAGQTTAPQSSDDGEAPSDLELDELKTLVFEQLQWKKQFATGWLKQHFDVKSSADLTRQQLKTAFTLLYAFGQGQPAYVAALKVQVEAGRCRA